MIGSRAPRNVNKRPAEPSAPAPAPTVPSPLPPLAPKPTNGSDLGAAGDDAARPSYPTPLPIPVPMPFGLEVLTRYQALLGQGKTDLDPAAFVAGNLMSIMAKSEHHLNGSSAAPEAAPSVAATSQGGRAGRALLSSLLGGGGAGAGRREAGDVRTAAPPSSKVMTYQDLPYMGEMTLDNMKPRRGRKPKKADICHLIYKNYGTVFPKREVDVNVLGEQLEAAARPPPAALVMAPPPSQPAPRLSRTDVQSRIISSLLEKRLTQEEQALGAAGAAVGAALGAARSEEPLNLCLRDHNPLKLKLLRKHGNFYESNGGSALGSNAPCPAAQGRDTPTAVKSEPGSPESEVIEVDADPSLVNQEDDDDDDEEMDGKQPGYPSRQDMLYWPGPGLGAGLGPGGMYSHPLLYGKGFSALPALPAGLALSQIPQLQVVPSLPPLPPLLRIPGLEEANHPTDQEVSVPMAAPPPRGRHPQDSKRPPSRAKGRPSPSPGPGHGLGPSPPKRKRSAIFIPPVPAESSSNPTTEVSGLAT